MQLSNDQIILLSELLIKCLKQDIEEKNKIEEIPPSFIEFKDLVKEMVAADIELMKRDPTA